MSSLNKKEISQKESNLEKALKMSNDEVLAKAIQEMLKRDEQNLH